MILKETLRKIVNAQKKTVSSIDLGIERTVLNLVDTNPNQAIIISGIRRCGKSTLLRQIMKKIKKFYYFSFEDPNTVNFELEDFTKLEEVFEEEFGKCNYYFLDEIQNIEKWELFVRAMLDKGKKFFITGSNASLLSRELGTRLTGRHLNYELFPFSFNEYLKFKNKKATPETFKDYIKKGGFPEYLQKENPEVLQELLNDILARDIVVRHGLKNAKIVKEMLIFLISNVGKEFSYNKIKNIFELGSTNSVISFVSYFEDGYLLFPLQKFDYSYKKQLINPKKIYAIDNGLANINAVNFSSEKGRLLENAVFVFLKQKYKELFYFKEKKECDFLIKEKNRITQAIQVCYELNEDNKKREIEGLLEAMKKVNLKKGKILTLNQEDKLSIEGKEITIIPTWKWMLK